MTKNKVVSIIMNFFKRLFGRAEKDVAPQVLVDIPQVVSGEKTLNEAWVKDIRGKATKMVLDEVYSSTSKALEEAYKKQLEELEKHQSE